MEPETPALSPSDPELHSLPVEFHEINTELCKENVIYTELRVNCSSNIQKNKTIRILKTKGSPWCIATITFAFLYLIVLVVAAIMIAKVNYLKEVLKAQEIGNQNKTECWEMPQQQREEAEKNPQKNTSNSNTEAPSTTRTVENPKDKQSSSPGNINDHNSKETTVNLPTTVNPCIVMSLFIILLVLFLGES